MEPEKECSQSTSTYEDSLFRCAAVGGVYAGYMGGFVEILSSWPEESQVPRCTQSAVLQAGLLTLQKGLKTVWGTHKYRLLDPGGRMQEVLM